jgi:hypothetical protein
MQLDSWAIDSHGLRAAHSQSVLDQIRSRDELHIPHQPEIRARMRALAALAGPPFRLGQPAADAVVTVTGRPMIARPSSKMSPHDHRRCDRAEVSACSAARPALLGCQWPQFR